VAEFKKKPIVMDFGTSWDHRIHPPVGIVRCEHELARYLLERHADDVIFAVFHAPSSTYRELSHHLVRDIVFPGRQAAPAKEPALASARPAASRLTTLKALCLLGHAYAMERFGSPTAHEHAVNRAKAHVLAHHHLIDRAFLEFVVNSVPARWILRPHHVDALRYLMTERPPQFNVIDQPLVPFDAIGTLLLTGVFWSQGLTKRLAEMKQEHGFRLYALIYDLIPIKVPQFSEIGAASNFSACLHYLYWAADGFACISESTERDLRSNAIASGYEPLGPDATLVTPLGPAQIAEFSRTGKIVAVNDDRIVPERFVLFVSTLEARKNHALAYMLWRRLAEKHGRRTLPLVFVGYTAWGVNELCAMINRDPLVTPDYIVHLSGIPDEKLAWLYSNCSFTIFPSHYEGWGMPISESLAFGKPCIAGEGSSLREASQGLAEHVDIMDSAAWLARIETMMFDPQVRKNQEALIKKEFKNNSWHDFSSKLVSFALADKSDRSGPAMDLSAAAEAHQGAGNS
jgi:glycosyltransferase involved in cell wall biosynthesis